MPTQKKIEQAAKIDELLKESNGFYIIDYRGLTVKQFGDLRKKLRDADATCAVLKNNIFRMCLKNAGYPEMDELLEGPNAIIFYNGDLAAPAKAVKDMANEIKLPTLKGGYADGKAIDADAANAIAELPSREQLLSTLLRTMQNPMSKFARAISLIAEQKNEEPAA